jgi:hypothetical protein
MNHRLTSEFVQEFVYELRTYVALCEEVLNLATQENQALAGRAEHQPFEFDLKRKDLLPDIESLLTKLRQRRQAWQQIPAPIRENCEEVKPLFQTIQNLVMRVLLLDRENQQAMLRRGLVPANHLPAAIVPKPNYVADLYRRNYTA